jgi:predicted secreted protein
MRSIAVILLGLTLVTGTTVVAQAQAPDWRQAVGELLNGNHDRDDAVRQAYERGYRRGRDDEARASQGRALRDDRYDRRGYYSR